MKMSWWSGPGCIFSTQTGSADISSKINCCGRTCWKRNQDVSRHLATYYCWSSVYTMECGDSQGLNCQMHVIAICGISLRTYAGWVLYGYDCLPPTRFVLHNTMCYQSVRVFFIRSRRINHKHEKMLSDHRDAGLEQIWPRMADENLPTNLLVFCYLKSPWIHFLMCYQLVENKSFIIKTTNWQKVMQIFGNVSMTKK